MMARFYTCRTTSKNESIFVRTNRLSHGFPDDILEYSIGGTSRQGELKSWLMLMYNISYQNNIWFRMYHNKIMAISYGCHGQISNTLIK